MIVRSSLNFLIAPPFGGNPSYYKYFAPLVLPSKKFRILYFVVIMDVGGNTF